MACGAIIGAPSSITTAVPKLAQGLPQAKSVGSVNNQFGNDTYCIVTIKIATLMFKAICIERLSVAKRENSQSIEYLRHTVTNSS
jgi:hypothetical protein